VELGSGDAVTFIRPDGRRIDGSPPLACRIATGLAATVSANSLRCWDGTRFDLAYVIDVFRGHEPCSCSL